MVFVDELFQAISGDRRAAFIGKRTNDMWCHMWTVDPVDELHAMAKSLGLKREWFQDHNKTPHYDLTPKKREQALKLGAVEFPARAWAKWSLLLAYDPKQAEALRRARIKTLLG